MAEPKLVLLTRIYDVQLAHIIRGTLEANDVPCFIFDEQVNTTAWHLQIGVGGVRVMVFSTDLDIAHELIDNKMFSAIEKQSNTPGFQGKFSKWREIALSFLIAICIGIPIIFKNKKNNKDEK